MIRFYYAPQSRAFRILWLLEEMGIPYQWEVLNLKRGDHKSPRFLEINPMGKVPTVEVNGAVVWESPAIVTHLLDLHPELKMAPAVGTPARADYYRWMSFSTAVIEPAFMDHMMNQHPNPSAAGWGTFDSMKKGLADAFKSGPYVLGSDFSGADIMIGANLNWFVGWAKGAFDDVPGLHAYVERIRMRPAFKKANAKDAAMAASQQA